MDLLNCVYFYKMQCMHHSVLFQLKSTRNLFLFFLSILFSYLVNFLINIILFYVFFQKNIPLN